MNYSHIVYIYSKPFYFNAIKKRYKTGTKISDIENYFIFNRNLSQFLYASLSRFEHELKRAAAYFTTEETAFDYTNREFYDLDFIKQEGKLHQFNKFIDAINWGLKYFNDDVNGIKYNTNWSSSVPPFWIFVNEMSLGMIIKYISFVKKNMRDNIFSSVKQMTLNKLGAIQYYRNKMFHFDKLNEFPFHPRDGGYDLETFVKILMKYESNTKIKDFWQRNKKLLNCDLIPKIYSLYWKNF